MYAFEKKVEKFIQKHQLIDKNDHLLIACSGGVDSMALLEYLRTKKEQWSIEISCVHVDHMLRGQQSYEDLLFVKEFCEKHDISFYGASIDIPQILQKTNGNVQATCREERYNYFEQIMNEINATKLLTAHHGDDQIESVFMSLTHNSSVKGLIGIEPIRMFQQYRIVRPFLSVTKSDIREYIEKKGIDFREDPSNAKDDYTRNRFRHSIVPVLKGENPNLHMTILQLSSQIQEDEKLLMEMALERFGNIVTKTKQNGYNFEIKDLKANPVALQRRLILILLNYIYGSHHTYQTYLLIDSILTLCDKQDGHAEIHLPEQFLLKRSYSSVRIGKEESFISYPSMELKFNEWQQFGMYKVWFGNSDNTILKQLKSPHVFYVSSSQISLPLIVRSVQQGDRILLKGMNQQKRVSRIFIDEKIPVEERKCVPIIEDTNSILVVGDIKHSHIISKSERSDDDMMIIIQNDSL